MFYVSIYHDIFRYHLYPSIAFQIFVINILNIFKMLHINVHINCCFKWIFSFIFSVWSLFMWKKSIEFYKNTIWHLYWILLSSDILLLLIISLHHLRQIISSCHNTSCLLNNCFIVLFKIFKAMLKIFHHIYIF
jgi:hypothetical protein